jgi:S-DNA-T family DNA segregation ATPase FtsK/SpoIIIE
MTLPVLGGAVAMALLAGRGGGPQTYLIGGLFGISALAMVATGWGATSAAGGRAELAAARRDYLRYLADVRDLVRRTAREQHRAAHHRHPDPRWLWAMVPGPRLWERRRDDPDVAEVRVGVGTRPLATPLSAVPAGPGEEPDPDAEAAQARLVHTYRQVGDLPLPLALPALPRVRLAGDMEVAAGVARAVVAQLATFHAPDDLRIAVCAGASYRARWEWVKWLPHAHHPGRRDGAGALRLVAGSLSGLLELFDDQLPAAGGPLLVVVRDVDADRADPSPDGPDGVILIDLAAAPARPPGPGEAVLDLDGDRVLVQTAAGETATGAPDLLTVAEAEALARRLAPLRLAGAAAAGDGTRPDYAALLGIDPDTYHPARAWAARPAIEQLRVPIGTDGDGHPVVLDLKESAAGGIGPHGLLVGATGSGKSELLRAIVLGLAATHSSEDLNLVLIDFKGGATFASFDRLPHTAAVITNLADELPLVDRMTDALNGELVRRQELLRDAGNHSGRDAYQRARVQGAPLPPLPVLLVVCDEFSELLAAKPDFIDLFVQIGRLGRSLGVHLLLASQRLDEGRLRGLETHLSYRIGLRTFSALESRAVLGVPDAYELPRAPGHGYLTSGAGDLVRFTAAPVTTAPVTTKTPGTAAPTTATPGRWMSRPAIPPPGATGRAAGPGEAGAVRVLPYGTHRVATPAAPPPEPAGGGLPDLLVSRLADAGPPAHQVWLPPLTDPPTLGDLLGPVRRDPARGLCVVDTGLHGALRVPVAVVDRPFQQRRDALWWRLDGAAGHVAVVGGPRSGRSTAVMTLLCALALTHTPTEVTAYCLDFGGGSLARLRRLPHVGGVAGRPEVAAVRRTVGELATLLADRERRATDGTGDPYGEVFLVVDGWTTLRGEFEDLEETVADLAARGLSYGIHVVATAGRWLDFRPAVRDLFGSRLELRLGEPADSVAGHRAAATVPEGVPGRGVTADGLHLLTALPELPGTELVAAVAAAWAGPAAPPVRLLPRQVPYQRIAPAPAGADRVAGLRLPIGIGETDLEPVEVDLGRDAHLVVFGDAECGKSSFLRALATSVTRRFPPEQARIVLVDYRRSLLEAVTTDHLIGYGTAADASTELLESVAAYLRRRLPAPEVTPAQLRERSWWAGPECFVLVDDYDLVTAGGASPVAPLLPYLPQARDVGLHLVLARRSGGAARAMYEPVLQRLRELAVPGLVMSGDPAEGALVGSVGPAPLPPGRGWLVTRRHGPHLVQLAHLPNAGDRTAPPAEHRPTKHRPPDSAD